MLSPSTKRSLIVSAVVLGVLIAAVGFTAWYKLFRQEPEPNLAGDARFLYGSVGAEEQQGLPFWIWVVLPRIFPEYLPGSGGYRSLGIPWAEGEELPMGFSKRVIGFPRIGENCAICHVTAYRAKPTDPPTYVAAGPNHTINILKMLEFLTKCANDPRFEAGTLLGQIEMVTHLSILDRLLYRFLIIPKTREALQEQSGQFAWTRTPGRPHWGPGRDDSMNLSKFVLTKMPFDNSISHADFPPTWNLKAREGKRLLWGGAVGAIRTQVVDSALGLGARPDSKFEGRMKWLIDYLSAKQPPPYPKDFEQHPELIPRGKELYATHCDGCHGLHAGTRVGQPIPLAEIGTDAERHNAWSQRAADLANQAVAKVGVDRPAMEAEHGYIAVVLDGVWLRAPYLHNGSVPSLADLLKPAADRPLSFYRGCDLYDQKNVGFVTDCDEARSNGEPYSTSERGNSKSGHEYGTALSSPDKSALIEYLKTL